MTYHTNHGLLFPGFLAYSSLLAPTASTMDYLRIEVDRRSMGVREEVKGYRVTGQRKGKGMIVTWSAEARKP